MCGLPIRPSPSSPLALPIYGDPLLCSYQCYCPAAEDTSEPSRKVTWNESTKPPEIDQSNKSIDFQLGMNLLYCCGKEESETVVYEGASADVLLHTIRLKDSTKLSFYDSNLQLLDQPSFLNMPNTPQEYRNEAGTGLTLYEAQALSRPRTLSPLQQEFMIWHHRLYHLPYQIIFRLASLSFLPKRMLECRNKPPLCVA